MPTLGDVLFRLRADTTELKSGLTSARADLVATSNEGGKLGSALRDTAVVGATMAASIGAAGVASVKSAMDFQDLTTTLVTGAGESEANLELVRQGVLNLAGVVGEAPEQLAQGLYMIESAGYHGAQGLQVLKAAAEGAKVGQADMATVADAVTSALKAYRLSADQAVPVTNTLIAAVAAGKMHMQDLAGALGTVLPAASTAHVGLQEVTAAIATMTAQGTPAADAATYLRQTILMLENPSKKAQDALAGIGLKAKDVGETLGHKGLAATLELITSRLAQKFPEDAKKAEAEFAKVKSGVEDVDTAMANLANNTSPQYIAQFADMVGGTRSMQAALELSGANLQTFQANIAAITGAVKDGGDQVRGWALIQQDASQQASRAWDSVKAGLITLGQDALTPLANVFGTISDKVQAFTGWVGQVEADLSGATTPAEHFHSRLADLNSDMGDDSAKSFADRLRNVGDWINQYVLPPGARFVGWIEHDAIPGLQRFGGFVVHDVLPPLEQLGHTVYDVGHFVVTDLGPPVIAFIRDAGTPLVHVFGWFADHETVLITLLSIIAARFVAIKAAGAAAEVVKFVDGFMSLAQGAGKLQAVLGVLGMGGNSGLSGAIRGVAGEWRSLKTVMGDSTELATVATGAKAAESKIDALARVMGVSAQEAAQAAPELAGAGEAAAGVAEGVAGLSAGAIAATGGIAALGIAALGLATDAGGVRTAIKNAIWGEDQRQAYDEARSAIDDMRGQLVQGLVDGGSEAEKSVSQAFDVIKQKVADTTGTLVNTKVEISGLPALMDKVRQGGTVALDALWAEADKGGKAFLGLRDTADSAAQQMAQNILDAANRGDTDWGTALDNMQSLMDQARDHSSSAFGAIGDEYDKLMADMNRQSNQNAFNQLSSADQIRQAFADTATQMAADQHKQGKAAQDFINGYVDAHMKAFAQLNPQWQAANQKVHDMATYLGLSDDAVKQMGPDAAAAAVAMKEIFDAANQRAQTLANQLNTITADFGTITSDASGGQGSTRHFARGGKVLRGNPTTGIFEGDETEWVVTESQAPPWLQMAMDQAITGGAPEQPTSSQGMASVIAQTSAIPVPVASGRAGGGGPVTVVVELDGREIARKTAPHLVKEIRARTGVKA